MVPKSLAEVLESLSSPQTRGQGLKDFLQAFRRGDRRDTEEIVDSPIIALLTEIIVPSQIGESNETLHDALRALDVILVRVQDPSKHMRERMNDTLTEKLIGNLLLLWASEDVLVFEKAVLSVYHVASLSGELKTRIMRCGIVSAALKIRRRLHEPRADRDVAGVLWMITVPYGQSVLESGILYVAVNVLAKDRLYPTPKQFRELLPLISRTLNKGYQGRDFPRACDILAHLVGKVKTAADSVYASGLVHKMVRFLDLSNPPEVKVKVMGVLIEFAGNGSRYCHILLKHKILEKVYKLVNIPEQAIIQTLSLQLLLAIVYQGSSLVKRTVMVSNLYGGLAALHHRGSLNDKKLVLRILQCIHNSGERLSSEFRRILGPESFSDPTF